VRAQEFLESIATTVKHGFCHTLDYAPTKANGYVQLSWRGANKFCTLGEMLGWAQGINTTTGCREAQISHLCHNPKCVIPSHVVLESPVENNRRKNCLVWVNCPHDGCEEKVFVCTHSPPCIKYALGWETWEEFLRWGVHKKKTV
jgi:hypothetical protein